MIHPGKLPIQIGRTYSASLADFVAPGSDVWGLLAQSPLAHAVHNLDIEEVLASVAAPSKKLEDMATEAGWRFIAAGGGVAGAAHVRSADANGNASPKLSGFSVDSRIETLLELINELDKLPFTQEGNFELRTLRITWLKFEALWLHSANDDWIIPYGGFVETCDLTRGSVYTADEFLKAIQSRAKTVKAQFTRQKAARLRVHKYRHPQGSEEATKEADRLDAMAQVLTDINKASDTQIVSALQIDPACAGVICTQAKQAPIKNFDDLSKINGVNGSKLAANKHCIGYGEQASASGA